jgi:putative transposase
LFSLIPFKRNRTSFKDISYGLYLYFLGLSFRNASKALTSRIIIKRSHVSIWKWVQKYKPQKISQKRRKVSEFIIDETQIKVGNNYFWIWVAINESTKVILDIRISLERTILIAEQFLKNLIKEYGKHPLSTDSGTWYSQACKFLEIEHHLHSPYEKSIIERTIQYLKDRTEIFDDYFPCYKMNCKLKHIMNWFNLFVDHHNKEVIS